ncbi:MAG: TonB-dependent receptor [Bacteroidales bacterium]|nr:TonB-dependent receptor [Bacteroidales bacterium]MBN2817674.1 TonB-dependent receptor [Bacteroidales bacterium]
MLRNVILFAFLFVCLSVFSQFSVSGIVTDENNIALIGATVSISESTIGVITDKNGHYEITNLKPGEKTIVVSFLGYKTTKKEIDLVQNIKLNFELEPSSILADEVIVVSTRASADAPVTYTNVGHEEITKRNLGQDIPVLLSTTPSMVVSTDAGNGIGYTSFRIRGTDANRTNITVNGIPMNDAESHGVWWVNMPDFSSSTENVQVQRGVGTSTNGAGAFGASINLQTNTLEENPYAVIASSAGSFNTFKNTIKVGTGLIKDHFAFDARLSKISSDGYVDRASSDLKSFFFSGSYYSKSTIVKANIFSGKEKTYQAWWGVPKVRLENDMEGMERYEEHGLYTPEQTLHMLNSDSRTYNYYTYNNETDNYQQDHAQLFFSQRISSQMHFNAALHYTYGRGYYEQYRTNDDLADYNLPNIILSSDTITSTDLVRQKWLDNDFYGTVFSLSYNSGIVNAVIGGSWNKYDGRHFGNIIWGQYLGETAKDYEWYSSTGTKTDLTSYARASINIESWISLFADIQARTIDYNIDGIDDDYRDITQNHHYTFLNPKLGIHLIPGYNQKAYVLFAMAHREPNRANYTDAINTENEPIPEKLRDIEAGYSYNASLYTVGINLYYMNYKDQLILTGQINDVGSAIMTNVEKSFRRGIEIMGTAYITQSIKWDANATFSQNKIIDFTEYVDNWVTWGQEQFYFDKTNIAFSPALIANSILSYSPVQNLEISLTSQYVSKQYIDNSSSEDRMLDAYFINNFGIAYSVYPKWARELKMNLLINNFLNEEYESNAWVYSYILGDERYEMDGYFTQAGINFLGGVTVIF